jgi:hypothetical protein
LQTNDVVNWIAIDAFRHCANLSRTRPFLEPQMNPDKRWSAGPGLSFPVEISGYSHFFGLKGPGPRPAKVGKSPNN